MQPHSCAIMAALHHRHFQNSDTKRYLVRCKSPKYKVYELTITSDSSTYLRIRVDGQVEMTNFWNCDATINRSNHHYRLRHHHSPISEEEWYVDIKQIYNGRFRSEKGYTSSFRAIVYGGLVFSFTESGGVGSGRYELEVETK